jgi:hypothetical protein
MKLLSLVLLLMLFAVPSFGVGTTTVTKTAKAFGKNGRLMEVVQIDFVGDASTGSVPDTSLTISGYVYKVITNPGSTAPTANYDIVLGDAEDSTLDALASALLNRHTTTTEQVYPKIAGTIGTVSSDSPLLAPGTYTLGISGNSVASATGRILLFLVDRL